MTVIFNVRGIPLPGGGAHLGRRHLRLKMELGRVDRRPAPLPCMHSGNQEQAETERPGLRAVSSSTS